MKLFKSEIEIMEKLWEYGDLSAAQLAKVLASKIGWNKNTTYTVIKKLVDKGAVKRYGTNYMCHANVSRIQVQQQMVKELMDKMFMGSASVFLATYVQNEDISPSEIERLKKIINDM